MTKLNETQEALLEAVAKVKEETDAALEELAHHYRIKQYEAERPLRLAVGEAADAGVPWRRLQEPLETSDHKTVKSFYPTSGDRLIVKQKNKKGGK